MTPYYADDWLTVYLGDCREVMATMEPESVHCVVTSPPYWGLRDYGTATWVGGDEACDHRIGRDMGNANKGHVREVLDGDRTRCKCGAIRQDSQLGLEPTPEQYVENMVAVFREVRRVLRSDGTVWLNLGDSYGGGPGAPSDKSTLLGNGHVGGGPKAHAVAEVGDYAARGVRSGNAFFDFKPKDLVGIPWLVALALRADGWYLRSDIIWSKPNPMPESVTDRPTKSHEYLFLLSKSPRYYFDADAVAERSIDPESHRGRGPRNADKFAKHDPDGFARTRAGFDKLEGKVYPTRNIRSVWTIATQPYPGAHFATFPPKLVEPCIKAGCPEGGVVLDPFAGSGTTAMVAQSLSRRAVLIDLNADYLEQVMDRNRAIPLGLGESA